MNRLSESDPSTYIDYVLPMHSHNEIPDHSEIDVTFDGLGPEFKCTLHLHLTAVTLPWPTTHGMFLVRSDDDNNTQTARVYFHFEGDYRPFGHMPVNTVHAWLIKRYTQYIERNQAFLRTASPYGIPIPQDAALDPLNFVGELLALEKENGYFVFPEPAPTWEAKAVLAEAIGEAKRQREEKNQAYSERNQLVALLARIYPSGIRATDIPGWNPEWQGCVYIDLPDGQISYHYHNSEADMFRSLPAYTKPWDGHNKELVHDRLRAAWRYRTRDDQQLPMEGTSLLDYFSSLLPIDPKLVEHGRSLLMPNWAQAKGTWMEYVPEELRQMWIQFTYPQRVAIGKMAMVQSDHAAALRVESDADQYPDHPDADEN
jgi:hypothetical protein